MATPPSLSELTRVFARIGVLSFGGPAAQISLMHREVVDLRPWLTEQQFLRALSLCMLLPGPEAMQLATYAGWRLRGVPGGLIAGTLFVLPGAVVIFALALGYARFGQVPLVQAAFTGIQAAVLAIVLQALIKLARKALNGRAAWVIAGLAFGGVFLAGAPFPAVIALAALYGAFGHAPAPAAAIEQPSGAGPIARGLRQAWIWLVLWALPLAILWLAEAQFLLDIALFFSKLAVVTFGGAYALLAYMTQTVVSDYGWITTAEMIDALGLAETTPGPLILVTQFVAVLAGAKASGTGLGLLAGVIALWVTFVPCFLWIFVAGPYLDALTTRPRLNGALQAITAAVVGVILNLALWFATHVLFADVGRATWLAAPLPRLDSLDVASAALVVLAAALLLGARIPLIATLVIMAIAGVFSGLL